MRDKVKGRGNEQQMHSTGYSYLRLQTQPLTPKPCSTKQRGTGGPWPGSACGLGPQWKGKEGRKKERKKERQKEEERERTTERKNNEKTEIMKERSKERNTARKGQEGRKKETKEGRGGKK